MPRVLVRAYRFELSRLSIRLKTGISAVLRSKLNQQSSRLTSEPAEPESVPDHECHEKGGAVDCGDEGDLEKVAHF